MIMNMIFLLCMYPVCIITFFVINKLSQENGDYHFGVYMKQAWMQSEQMKAITHDYKKQMRMIMLVGILFPLLSFCTSYSSIQFTIWMFWLLAFLGIIMIPYILAHKKTRAYKMTMGYVNSEQNISYVEMRVVENTRRVKIKDFILPIGVSVLAAVMVLIYGSLWHRPSNTPGTLSVYRYVILVFVLFTPLMYWMASIMDRQKSRVISRNEDVNVNYNRAKKQIWRNVWLQSCWTNTLYCILLTITIYMAWPTFYLVLWGSIVDSLLILYFALRAAKALDRIEKKYEAYKEEQFGGEDEKYWIWGIVYNNPWDKHVLVDKRFGVGSTINLATGWGKASVVVSVVALLSIPIMCIWMIFAEFTPIHVMMQEDQLVCEQMRVDYTISVADMKEVSLCNKQPDIVCKEVGTAMDNLNKGRFDIRKEGSCILFYNPKNEKLIRIETENRVYYIGGENDAETQSVYQALANR